MCSHSIFYCLNPVQFSILAYNVFNNVNVILAFSNNVNAILAFSNNVNVILAFLQKQQCNFGVFSSFPAKINIFWRFYIISCLYVVKLLLSEEGRNSETCYSDINCVDFDFSLSII